MILIKVSTSSNNGKSFYPHQEAMLCESCGEKTVICPHRSFEKELILALPLHATHIMVSRPYCREPPKYNVYLIRNNIICTS